MGRGSSGVSIGQNNAKAISVSDISLEGRIIEPLKPTSTAEDVFKSIYREARDNIKTWGYNETDAGFGNLDPNRFLSARTLGGIQYKISREEKDVRTDVKLGVLSEQEGIDRLHALQLIQKTLNRQVRSYKESGIYR